jgi:hypothetical protein
MPPPPSKWFKEEDHQLSVDEAVTDSIVNEEKLIGKAQDTTDNETATTTAEVKEEGKPKVHVSLRAFISHPRLIAASLLAFANGAIYNVFEVILYIIIILRAIKY